MKITCRDNIIDNIKFEHIRVIIRKKRKFFSLFIPILRFFNFTHFNVFNKLYSSKNQNILVIDLNRKWRNTFHIKTVFYVNIDPLIFVDNIFFNLRTILSFRSDASNQKDRRRNFI